LGAVSTILQSQQWSKQRGSPIRTEAGLSHPAVYRCSYNQNITIIARMRRVRPHRRHLRPSQPVRGPGRSLQHLSRRSAAAAASGTESRKIDVYSTCDASGLELSCVLTSNVEARMACLIVPWSVRNADLTIVSDVHVRIVRRTMVVGCCCKERESCRDERAQPGQICFVIVHNNRIHA
jgi:hypothetical protein